MKKMLSVKEVAESMSVCAATVRRWIKEGKLPATRLGRDWRIPEDAIQLTPVVERTAPDIDGMTLLAMAGLTPVKHRTTKKTERTDNNESETAE